MWMTDTSDGYQDQDDAQTITGSDDDLKGPSLERLSTSSRDTIGASSLLPAIDTFLDLEPYDHDHDGLSDGESLFSEDDDIEQGNGSLNGIEEGEDIALMTSAERASHGQDRPPEGRRRKRRKWIEAEQEFAKGGYKELWQVRI